MGKRKERRLAAKSTAGRRVKLDLFAEPTSGDLGGSVVQDEVGVDKESKHRAELPNSSSTSGQPENPLLLLGQYSDDELEEEPEKKPDNTSTGETSSIAVNDEAEALKEGRLDVNGNGDEVKQHLIDGNIASPDINQNLEDMDTRITIATTTGSSDVSKDLYAGQVSDSGAGEVNGDVRSSWHMVMDEESNRYYYWNVATGETSWEIPEALAQESELSDNPKTKTSLPSSVTTLGNPVSVINAEGFNPVECNGASEGQRAIYWSNDNVNCGSADASLDQNVRIDESGIDLSSSLIKHSESLLERLKSVIGLKHEQQSLDFISKYTLEVEIRLSDIRTLSSFGASLHPFWAHSERQLKRLEDSINLEIYKLAQSAVNDEGFQASTELEPEAGEKGNGGSSPAVENTDVSRAVDSSTITPESKNDVSPANEDPSEEASGGHPSPDDLIPNNESQHIAEDVDMDVDMEVEDASSEDADELGQPIEPVDPPPPPPDEEWVPPPPLDTEPIPPPEPVYIDPFVPYNLAYPSANFAYYGHSATDVAASNFFGQLEGSQVAVPQAPIYYSAVPSAYPESSLDGANNIATVDYYEFQDGALPAAPGVNAVGSSQFQAEPTPITYGSLAADRMGSVDSSVEVSNTLLPIVNDSSAIGGRTKRAASVEVPPPHTTTSIKAPAIVSAKENVPLPSTNQVSSTSTVTKVPTKVARSKKHPVAVAPTSRSSKKVASLVNKWKAAKEELLEDEEAPQTTYEILERKRQKEIEEWHAQQIASGEAKDNANFQPLGGDWRERVKRRRAQLAKENAQTSSEKLNDIETQQQPDLNELSKDLPSSWQVYWDESSKQVYYGNVITSETSWTRPK